MTGDGGTLQHDGIGLHIDGTQCHVTASHLDTLRIGLEAYAGHLQNIVTCLGVNLKLTLHVGQRTLHERAVRLQQFYRCLGNGVLCVVDDHTRE